MADAYTTHAKFTKMEVGSHETGWGAIINVQFDLIEQMAWGYESIALTEGITLDAIPQGAPGTTRNMALRFTGTLVSGAACYIPDGLVRPLIVYNDTNQIMQFRHVAGGAHVTVAAGRRAFLLCTGTNVYLASTTATNATLFGGLAPEAFARIASFNAFQKAMSYARVDLGPSASIAPDASLANVFLCEFSGASGTLSNPTNLTDGQPLVLIITGASMTSLTIGSKFAFPGGATPVYSGSGNVDIIEGTYDAAVDTIWAQYISDMG